ncbi:MAG: hypothetical protein VW685_02190 [Ilumatobacter sp.]
MGSIDSAAAKPDSALGGLVVSGQFGCVDADQSHPFGGVRELEDHRVAVDDR